MCSSDLIGYERFGDPEIQTRISQYEMAFRMQASVPELTDLGSESQATLDLYGPEVKKPGTFANTALLVIGVCFFAIFFSIMISWIVVRTKLKIGKVFDVAAILPHAIPGLAFAFGLFIIALTIEVWTGLALLGTLTILIAANVLNHISYTTRVTNAALIQIHNELEEASRTCGVSQFKTIFFVLIPLIRPALVFVTVWVALRTFREMTTALFLTGTDNKVMAVEVWLMWNEGGLAQAAAGAVVMTVGCAVLLFIGFLVSKGGVLNRAAT